MLVTAATNPASETGQEPARRPYVSVTTLDLEAIVLMQVVDDSMHNAMDIRSPRCISSSGIRRR